MIYASGNSCGKSQAIVPIHGKWMHSPDKRSSQRNAAASPRLHPSPSLHRRIFALGRGYLHERWLNSAVGTLFSKEGKIAEGIRGVEGMFARCRIWLAMTLAVAATKAAFILARKDWRTCTHFHAYNISACFSLRSFFFMRAFFFTYDIPSPCRRYAIHHQSVRKNNI